jgi:hypothetical protein
MDYSENIADARFARESGANKPFDVNALLKVPPTTHNLDPETKTPTFFRYSEAPEDSMINWRSYLIGAAVLSCGAVIWTAIILAVAKSV